MAYKPPRIIKLFKLEVPSSRHEHLAIRMKPFHRDDPPLFDAISFTWGPHSLDNTLLCDDDGTKRRVKAPRSLVECLEQLRDEGRVHSFYWAFAISGDLHSGYQASLPDVDVASIFARANQVLCWLGPLHGPLDTVPTLSHAYQSTRQGCFPHETSSGAGFRGADVAAAAVLEHYQRDIKSMPPAAWQAWDELLSRRFFSRSWVAVEAICARDLIIRCGQLEARWDDVYLALRGCDLFACPSPIKSDGLQLLLSVQTVRRLLREGQGPVPQGRLMQEVLAVLAGPGAETSRLGDRIQGANSIFNAIYGMPLIGSTRDDFSNMSDWVKVACNINQMLGRPFTLSLAGSMNPEPQQARPSWVPDWGVSRTRFLLDAPDECFSASTILQQEMGLSLSQPPGLLFAGFAVDRVGVTACYLPLRRHADHYESSGGNSFFLGEWSEWADEQASRFGKNEVLLEFAETIQAKGCGWKFAAAMPADRQLFTARARKFLDFLENEGADESYDVRLFYAACYPSHGRMFGITAGGRFCLLPRGTRAGDMICIPHGNRVPVVLREVGSCYSNLGECYVHGLMHGQVGSMANMETQNFVVR